MPTDDFGGDVRTRGALALGRRVSGRIDFDDDTDWFALDLVAGRRYQFSLTQEEPVGPFLALYDAAGRAVRTAAGREVFSLSGSLSYRAETSGRFFIGVEDLGTRDLSPLTYQLSLAADADNHAPVLAAALPDRTAVEGRAFRLQLPAGTFTDADSDTLVFRADMADTRIWPTWLRFDTATGTLSGTPPARETALEIRITADDRRGGLVSDTFRLDIQGRPDGGGDTVATATDVGRLTLAGRAFGVDDRIGGTDRNDYFRFILDAPSLVDVQLGGLTEGANLDLLNAGGSSIERGSVGADRSRRTVTGRALDRGTYLVRVASDGTQTDYNLNLVATARDEAGNTVARARSIGVPFNTESRFVDFVGTADPADFYRFTVTYPSNVQFTLSGMTADANLALYNATMRSLGASNAAGRTDEVVRVNLAAGSYYVAVRQGRDNTPYTLGITSTPVDTAGNSITGARNLGSLTEAIQVTDFISSADPRDYFRFAVPDETDVRLSMSDMRERATLVLFSVLGRSLASVDSDRVLSRHLSAGTYYAAVTHITGETPYTLHLATG